MFQFAHLFMTDARWFTSIVVVFALIGVFATGVYLDYRDSRQND